MRRDIVDIVLVTDQLSRRQVVCVTPALQTTVLSSHLHV